jgi:hypothetical protein
MEVIAGKECSDDGSAAVFVRSVRLPDSCPGEADTLSSNFFPDNKISVVTDQWCKEAEKRTTAGSITQFTGGTLTPPAQTYAGVIKGWRTWVVFSYTADVSSHRSA